MATTNLNVQELDFFKIRESLIEYLRSKPEFTDYDFEGSSLTVLLDLLSYNQHYHGFFAHMLANESFIDSANQMSSMTSKAKLFNYIPKSKKSAEATVQFTVNITELNEPSDRKIIIERGSTIQSDNNSSDSRTFVVVDDIVIYNNSQTIGVYEYVSDEVLIYEGSFEEERFLVDNTLVNQRFILRNQDIDITSLRVNVYPARGDTDFTPFKIADDFMNIDGASPIFFLSVNEDGYYEIFFGNDIYGKKVDHNNFISCTYVACSGATGNNAKVFSFDGDYTYNGNPFLITIQTISNAEGGMERESVEDLRLNVPYHYRRQNRAVTVDDYRNILLSEYRNINSINVWGGEDNDPKTYGSVFISIKPLYGEVLSSKAKENIINNILKKHNITAIDIIIVDPEYLYLDIDVYLRYNPVNTDKSSGQIKTGASAAVDTYNTEKLNVFGGYYSDVDLNSAIKATDSSILTSYTEITLERRFTPSIASLETYYIEFLNEIVPGGLKSDEFEYRLKRSYFTDDLNGNIIIYFYNDFTKAFEAYDDDVDYGTVDYKTGQVRLLVEFGGVYSTSGVLNVFAEPKLPDFFTKRNNIVVIDDVNVSVTIDAENENTKV